TTATMRWYVDRTLLLTTQVSLANGETTLSQAIKPTGTGFHSVRVTIDPTLDTYAENNLGEALVQVVGPPRVLLVEHSDGDAATPLEGTLPVQIELPKNMPKPPVAVMLVLETTESSQGDQVLRGAADAVIDQLTQRDFAGVTNGNGGNIVMPLTQLTDKAKLKSAIDGMALGDPHGHGAHRNAPAT